MCVSSLCDEVGCHTWLPGVVTYRITQWQHAHTWQPCVCMSSLCDEVGCHSWLPGVCVCHHSVTRLVARCGWLQKLTRCRFCTVQLLVMSFQAPALFILKLTIPVVDYGLPRHNWNKHLSIVQCIVTPVFCIFAISNERKSALSPVIYVTSKDSCGQIFRKSLVNNYEKLSKEVVTNLEIHNNNALRLFVS